MSGAFQEQGGSWERGPKGQGSLLIRTAGEPEDKWTGCIKGKETGRVGFHGNPDGGGEKGKEPEKTITP